MKKNIQQNITKVRAINIKLMKHSVGKNTFIITDPDLFAARLREVEAARQRMQEKYNETAELAKQQEEEVGFLFDNLLNINIIVF